MGWDQQHDEAKVLLSELEVLSSEDWVQNPYGGANPAQFEIFYMIHSIRASFGSEMTIDLDEIRQKYKNLMEHMKFEYKKAVAQVL